MFERRSLNRILRQTDQLPKHDRCLLRLANRAAQPPRTQGAEYAPSHTSRTRRCERDAPVVQTKHGAYKKCVSQSRHIPLSIRQDR